MVKPDLVAPGNQIISLLMNGNNWISDLYPQNVVPYSYFQSTGGDNLSYCYVWLSGTSMATPMVSGAAALMLQKELSLTPDQVKARLMKTASKSVPSFSTATDPPTGASFTSQYDTSPSAQAISTPGPRSTTPTCFRAPPLPPPPVSMKPPAMSIWSIPPERFGVRAPSGEQVPAN